MELFRSAFDDLAAAAAAFSAASASSRIFFFAAADKPTPNGCSLMSRSLIPPSLWPASDRAPLRFRLPKDERLKELSPRLGIPFKGARKKENCRKFRNLEEINVVHES